MTYENLQPLSGWDKSAAKSACSRSAPKSTASGEMPLLALHRAIRRIPPFYFLLAPVVNL